MSDTKMCDGCLRTLPLDEFPTRKHRGPHSRVSRCRTCRNRASAIWRSLHPDYQREWVARNPLKVAGYLRAQAARLEASVTEEPIVGTKPHVDIAPACADLDLNKGSKQ